MKKLTTCLLFIGTSLFAQRSTDSSIAIENILAMPDEELDIGLADLVLAKDFYPNLQIESFLFAFDYLADRYSRPFGHLIDPDERVRALNTFLFKNGPWNDSVTFSYDCDDLKVTKLSNKFINGFISTKKGSCITMPMIYLILAERLGFPIYASRLPYHFIVRYVPEKSVPNFQQNIEATNGGSYVSNKEYRQSFSVPDVALKNGVYLRTLTKKEYVASLLLTNANEWIMRKNLDKAKYYLELSMRYDSTFSSAYLNYGLIHLQEARMLEEELWEEKQDEIAFFKPTRNNTTIQQPQPSLPRPQDPEPAYNTYQIQFGSELSKKPPSQVSISSKVQSELSNSPKLQVSLAQMDQKYEPLIRAKIDIYHRYKQIAESLGIVKGYPLIFFKEQSEVLKKFQENGEN